MNNGVEMCIGRRRLKDIGICIMAAVSYLIIGYKLINASIWVDEAFTLELIQHEYLEMIRLTATDVHPPLYYLICKFGVSAAAQICPELNVMVIAKWVSFMPFVVGITFCTYMSKKENIIKEYETLREEMLQKIELHNSLITFMITTVVALLTFSLTQNEPLLYLLPFCIIIPITMRVTYSRTMMVKLSAYIIVYLEKDINGLELETRNTRFVNAEDSQLYNNLTMSHYYEGFLLGLVSYGLYLYNFIKDKSLDCSVIILALLPLTLVIWEWIITKRIAYFHKEKNKWISHWENFRNNSQ